MLRTAAQVRAIARHEPFDAKALAASKGKLQVVLLPAKLGAAARKPVAARSTDDDRLAVKGREVYWLPKGGMSDSALDMAGDHEAVRDEHDPHHGDDGADRGEVLRVG